MQTRSLRLASPALLVGLALLAGACSDDNNAGTGPGKTQTYNQVQRLGNPLISEVLLDIKNVDTLRKVRQRVRELTARFPLPY